MGDRSRLRNRFDMTLEPCRQRFGEVLVDVLGMNGCRPLEGLAKAMRGRDFRESQRIRSAQARAAAGDPRGTPGRMGVVTARCPDLELRPDIREHRGYGRVVGAVPLPEGTPAATARDGAGHRPRHRVRDRFGMGYGLQRVPQVEQPSGVGRPSSGQSPVPRPAAVATGAIGHLDAEDDLGGVLAGSGARPARSFRATA